MSNTNERPSSSSFEEVRNSAISFSGNAITYNVQGNQRITNFTTPKSWTPPVIQPPQAAYFVGRNDDLDWLLTHLKQGQPTILAICGPGGIGKTALVAEAVAQLVNQKVWRDRYPDGIYYYSFYPDPSLPVFFEDLARLYEEDPGANSYRAAVRALSRRQALLLFDGVEMLADTRPLHMFGGRNTILLISRKLSDAPDPMQRRVIGVLTEEQSLTLLQMLAGGRTTNIIAAKRLVQLMNGYPLALHLIGSYLQAYQQEVSEYLQWYEKDGLEALHHGEYPDQSIPVLLKRTYDRLPSDEQLTFLLLGLFALAPFPAELAAAVLNQPLQLTQRLLGALVNLGLLRRGNNAYEVSHALIHLFVKEEISFQKHVSPTPSREIVQIWHDRLVATLHTSIDLADFYDEQVLSLWLPHIMYMFKQTIAFIPQSINLAQLFNQAGYMAYVQARFAEAHLLWEQALAISEHLRGNDHPETGVRLNNLAVVHMAQGKHHEAEVLLKRVLGMYKLGLNGNHSDFAQSLNNLAVLYKNQGRYTEAEPLYQQALTIHEQELGDAPETATALNNLAELYRNQSKYTEAETLYKRAHIIWEQALGTMHPETATCLNNLSLLYESQGKYREALLLCEQVLTIRQQKLGNAHPETATCLNNLASLYENQGRYVQAEASHKQALAIRRQVLGNNHSDVAQSLNNLAALYRNQGRYAEAEPLLKQARAIWEQTLGSAHPETATCLNNLASLYEDQGHYAEAEQLFQQALAIREQKLGIAHPQTATSLNNLAMLYSNQGKKVEAEPLLKRAFAILKQHVGQNHPDTLRVMNNYLNLQAQMHPLPTSLLSKLKGRERNKACPCGSGKKYKKCCGI